MRDDGGAALWILHAAQDRLGDAEELLADAAGLVSLALHALENPKSPIPLPDEGPDRPPAA